VLFVVLTDDGADCLFQGLLIGFFQPPEGLEDQAMFDGANARLDY
jgi:hypothetical protein